MTETCLRRLNQLLNHYEHSIPYEVNLDDLEIVFSTSRRNTSNVLKLLSDHGWICWTPGVGRGKASTITITISMHQAIYRTVSQEININNFDVIAKLLHTYRGVAANALNQAMLEANRAKERSNTLVITQYPWVNELHPALTYRFSELQVIRSIYDTLFTVNDQGELENQIACAYKIKDRRIFLWIRSEIICHDGLPLTTDDVIYSLNVLKNTNGPVNGLFRQIEDVYFSEKEGAICILLVNNNPLFLYCLATANASITTFRNKHLGNGRSIAVGTGPFILESWSTDELILKKNQHYFSKNALLQEITLSHQGETLDNYISYNQSELETDNFFIQAFSYLAYNRRNNSEIDAQTIAILFDYLKAIRNQFSSTEKLQPMTLNESILCSVNPEFIPKLTGKLIFTHPKWTIQYLEELSNWLIDKIKETGIVVEVVELSNASAPQLMKNQADILIVEDIIEQPIEFGLYEWILTGTAIRFIYDKEQLSAHSTLVHDFIDGNDPKKHLINVFNNLQSNYSVLPLFWGKEEVMQTKQVKGLQINKTGYSDFYKLWINP